MRQNPSPGIYAWIAAALLLLAGVPGTSAISAAHAAQPADRQPPNFIVILVDDLGWMDLSVQGSEFYQTPHIDRLASQGMRFTDAYAACAVCSPTRAAVLTGRYPARTGITDWIRARFQGGQIPANHQNPTQYVGNENKPLLCPPNPLWMEHAELTVAELLAGAGYTSCHIGKWHLGPDAWYPTTQGFDRNIGGCDYGQPPSYFDPYTNRRLPQGIPTLQPRRKGEYLTDREADEAVHFIRQNRDNPFFLYLAHYAVHTPIQAKETLTQKYQDKPATHQANAKYAAMIESVDHATGQILDTLDELNLTERTVIIFTSDNGGLDRDGDPTDNAPLRSGKGYPHEGGIRVPLIIRWPGVVPPGTLSDQPVISVDYLPTIAQAAGVPLPQGREIDGLSLVDHLRSGGEQSLDRDALYWHFPHYRQGRRVTPYSIIRSGNWKLIKWHEGPTFELYNLADDLAETHDLSDQMPQKVEALNAKLTAHLQATGAKLPRPNPAYHSAP